MSLEAKFFKGYLNDEGYELLKGVEVLPDHSAVTRVVIDFGSAGSIDSQSAPTLFDLTLTDMLVFKLGGTSLPAGKYIGKVIIYSPDYPTGWVWIDDYEVEFI